MFLMRPDRTYRPALRPGTRCRRCGTSRRHRAPRPSPRGPASSPRTRSGHERGSRSSAGARRTSTWSTGRPTTPSGWSSTRLATAKPHSVAPKPCTTTTPMSSQACCSAGGRNAAAQMKSSSWPPRRCVDLAEHPPPQAVGQTAGDGPQAVELLRLALFLHFALDRRPEEVEHLRHDDHRRHAMGADGLEDDPRVARADVEDGGPDQERVAELELAEEMGERQQRDEAMLPARYDVIGGLERGQDVAVGQHGALRRGGRARGEDDLEERRLARPRPAVELRLPVGREWRLAVRLGLGDERRHGADDDVRELDLARVGGVSTGADGQEAESRRGRRYAR